MNSPAPNLPSQFQSALQLHQSGRFADAEREYRNILSADKNFAPAWHLLGILLMQTNRLQPAVEHIQHAIDLGLAGADTYNNLGEVLRASNRFDEAIAAYQRAIQLSPTESSAYANLATAYTETGRNKEALPHFQKSLSLRPDHVNTLYRYAQTLWNLGEHRSLIELLENPSNYSSAARNPPIAELLASAYYLDRQPEKSLKIIDFALAHHREFPLLHRHRSIALLALGRYTEGWAEQEWRWQMNAPDHHPARNFDRPMWDGSNSAGRKILVHSEQGYGDVIQFARYVPMLAAAGAEVILEIPAPVRDLLSSLRCKATIIPKGVNLPDFDLHIPLMSLPRIYETTPDSIPAEVPYLFANESRVEKFRATIQNHAHDKLKVGLVWAGNASPDPRRTVPSQQFFTALAPIPNISWFSLQTGPQTAELKDAPASMNILDLSTHLKDFADTAAAISLLDLTITIDTASAHLSGALAAKTWTLLTAAPDWRWGWDGPTTPWYPAMRLFRQQALGDWSPVLQAVVRELTTLHPAS